MTEAPLFRPGRNMAMKIPPHEFDATLRFYRDVLRLDPVDLDAPSPVFAFGAMRLHLDKVPHLSQGELWLEILTPDTEAAWTYLRDQGITRCDAVEPLPDGFDGFWIVNPPGVVHLIDGVPDLARTADPH